MEKRICWQYNNNTKPLNYRNKNLSYLEQLLYVKQKLNKHTNVHTDVVV